MRKTILAPLGFATVAAALAFGCRPAPSLPPAPEPIPPPVPTPTPVAAPAGLIDALNLARASNGLPALKERTSLDAIAANWAATMARTKDLTHGDFAARITAVLPRDAAAEDIASGQQDVQKVVQAWMLSPPHRANILGPYTLVGAGAAKSDDGTLFWCVDFANDPNP